MRRAITLSIWLLLAIPCSARIITVDDDGPADFAAIQPAIDDANDGDTIVMSDGIYQGPGNRDIDFEGKAITLHSKNGPENCVIDCNGTRTDPHRGFIFDSGEGPNSIVAGLTITHGYAPVVVLESGWVHIGGAIFCSASCPTINNCHILWNEAAKGGAIGCDIGASPTITNCEIRWNSTIFGSAIHCYHSSPIITNCIVSDNLGKAGITCEGGSALIQNCRISNNTGGGIRGSDLKVANCIISGNTANIGGGIHTYYSEGHDIITNCTIVGNSATGPEGYGGGISVFLSNATITNCILWGNEAKRGSQLHHRGYSVTISYSNVEGGHWADYGGITPTWGPGNISTDPSFGFDSDYHLSSDSPCIDAGDPNYTAEPNETDIDGNPRVLGGRIDMGAYEHNPTKPAITLSSTKFSFSCALDQVESQTLLIRNCGGGTLHWVISQPPTWLDITPATGASSGEIKEITLTVNPSLLDVDDYSCILAVSDPNASNSPRILEVDLRALDHIVRVPGQLTTIQDGIDHVLEGGMVIVADGTYTGDGNRRINFNGKAITVRSENGPANCIIDCERQGTGFNFTSGETKDSVLDGFTIRNGPGAIYCARSSPSIVNCIFANNGGERHCGGAMRNDQSSPAVVNCVFAGNYALTGGAMFNGWESNPILINCAFNNNIAMCRADPRRAVGGAIDNWNSLSVLSNCIFTGNSAGMGGAIFNDRAHMILTNCTFSGNSALDGNAMACEPHHTNNIQFKSCILWDGGDEIWNNNRSTIDITYSTIQNGEAGIYDPCNGVLWGEGNTGADPCFADPGYWDANDTPEDPNDDFWIDGDYHLKSQAGRWEPTTQAWMVDDVTSPCIDAGDPGSPIGLEPFPNGGIINMGAFGGTIEASKSYFGEPVCETIVAGDVNGDCVVNFLDFRLMALHWLGGNRH